MRLEDIGFYTLEDERAANVSEKTPLWRCELILSDRCNFNCPYCRGIKEEHKGDMSLEEAKRIVSLWASEGLRNIRFSGGEPTVWKGLLELVAFTKEKGISRIAISTNGYASLNFYKKLIDNGVNDFSISLDACCSSTGDTMAGGIPGAWKKVTDNIRELAKLTYVTVGVVLTENNLPELEKTIAFASDDLNVSDIRVISAAQENKHLDNISVRQDILDKHPILKYRISNFKVGKKVRSISENDNPKCPLVLDDMAVLDSKHFPCIIYLREQGMPIGNMDQNFRQQRLEWFKSHNAFKDLICQKNCLDVCVDYNNKVFQLNENWK